MFPYFNIVYFDNTRSLYRRHARDNSVQFFFNVTCPYLLFHPACHRRRETMPNDTMPNDQCPQAEELSGLVLGTLDPGRNL